MRIYLDVCCLGRYHDAPSDRIERELNAIKSIMEKVEAGLWTWITSPVIRFEIARNPDTTRRRIDTERMDKFAVVERPSRPLLPRVAQLRGLGFKMMDATHLAAAEQAKVDVLLSTDDNFLRKYLRNRTAIQIPVALPDAWLAGLGV